MKESEARVYDMAEEKTERQALLKGLEVQDPAVAEMLRVAAATYEAAAVLVLKAFDTVTQNPSL